MQDFFDFITTLGNDFFDRKCLCSKTICLRLLSGSLTCRPKHLIIYSVTNLFRIFVFSLEPHTVHVVWNHLCWSCIDFFACYWVGHYTELHVMKITMLIKFINQVLPMCTLKTFWDWKVYAVFGKRTKWTLENSLLLSVCPIYICSTSPHAYGSMHIDTFCICQPWCFVVCNNSTTLGGSKTDQGLFGSECYCNSKFDPANHFRQ